MINNDNAANSSTYVPFQDGLLVSPPYNMNKEIIEYTPFQDYGFGDNKNANFDERGRPKCEYCGKPAQHANCHAHKKWCPYYCNPNPMPLDGEPIILGSIALAYIVLIFIVKNIKKKHVKHT